MAAQRRRGLQGRWADRALHSHLPPPQGGDSPPPTAASPPGERHSGLSCPRDAGSSLPPQPRGLCQPKDRARVPGRTLDRERLARPGSCPVSSHLTASRGGAGSPAPPPPRWLVPAHRACGQRPQAINGRGESLKLSRRPPLSHGQPGTATSPAGALGGGRAEGHRPAPTACSRPGAQGSAGSDGAPLPFGVTSTAPPRPP